MTARHMQRVVAAAILIRALPAFSDPGAPPPGGPEAGATSQVVSVKDVILASHCERELVICYDHRGELIGNDDEPVALHPGNVVTVVVITNDAADKQAITITFAEQKNRDRLFPDQPIPARIGVKDSPPLNYFTLPFHSDPIADDSSELTIRFVRVADPPKTRVLQVDLGYSYYSVALLVATTFDGNRRVFRDLSAVTDHAIEPALALNVFPFGRQRGVIGFLRKCSVLRWQRCAGNMIGFQVATDLDLTSPTEKLYAGVVLEPIAGLALTGGVSLRKVDVVPTAGALPSLEAMDGSAPTDRRYVARGYLGITITLDLLDTISKVGSDIKKRNAP